MAIDSILVQIDAEIARLKQVRSLLAETGKISTKVIERTTRQASAKTAVKALVKTAGKAPVKSKAKKTRVLSPEARKRIADAQRKRWAAQKAKS